MASLHLAAGHSYRRSAIPAQTLYGQTKNATLSTIKGICSIWIDATLSDKRRLKQVF
jgi:hypothetical protein